MSIILRSITVHNQILLIIKFCYNKKKRFVDSTDKKDDKTFFRSKKEKVICCFVDLIQKNKI